MNFDQFNLDSRLMAGIKRLGYTTPTPIQVQTIPAAMAGEDIIGTAQTGTGKTASFVLPMIDILSHGRRSLMLGGAIAGVTLLLVFLGSLGSGVNKSKLERTVYHALLGLQVVVEDYVADKGRRTLVLIGIKFALVVAAVVGALAVLLSLPLLAMSAVTLWQAAMLTAAATSHLGRAPLGDAATRSVAAS